MSTIIPTGEAQVSVQWMVTGDAEAMVTTFGLQDALGIGLEPVDGPTTAGLIRDALIEAGSLCNPSSMSTSATFIGVGLAIGTIDGPVGVFAPAASVGTLALPMLPSNCAVLTQKRTATPGRKHRGRGYLPSLYLSEASVDINGVISGGSVANYNLFLAKILTDMAAINLDVVVQHSDGTPGTVVNSWVAATQIATQRRRMRR